MEHRHVVDGAVRARGPVREGHLDRGAGQDAVYGYGLVVDVRTGRVNPARGREAAFDIVAGIPQREPGRDRLAAAHPTAQIAVGGFDIVILGHHRAACSVVGMVSIRQMVVPDQGFVDHPARGSGPVREGYGIHRAAVERGNRHKLVVDRAAGGVDNEADRNARLIVGSGVDDEHAGCGHGARVNLERRGDDAADGHVMARAGYRGILHGQRAVDSTGAKGVVFAGGTEVGNRTNLKDGINHSRGHGRVLGEHQTDYSGRTRGRHAGAGHGRVRLVAGVIG